MDTYGLFFEIKETLDFRLEVSLLGSDEFVASELC
jgi:hypothetical protein